jgi:hypothetical protein
VVDRPRVIVCLPKPSESTAIADWLLADHFEPVRRLTPDGALEDMRRPFALLVTDVSLHRLVTQCRAQHPQIPIILIGNAATATHGDPLGTHTMYLSRPIDRAVLMCFVAMAILESRPNRRSVRKPVNYFDAVANGVASRIVDVSAEGLRLEVPHDARSALPPFFTVRVPLVGVSVAVQRMWSQSSSAKRASIWYGGALSNNRAGIAQAWRAFVDTIPVRAQTRLLTNP